MTQTNNGATKLSGQQHDLEQIRNEVKLALEEVMGDSSPEMLDEMAGIFLEDAVPLIAQAKEGLRNQDYTAVTMAAHALKGSSATIGLIKFSDVCLAVETSSKQKEDHLILQNLVILEAEYSTVHEALASFLL